MLAPSPERGRPAKLTGTFRPGQTFLVYSNAPGNASTLINTGLQAGDSPIGIHRSAVLTAWARSTALHRSYWQNEKAVETAFVTTRCIDTGLKAGVNERMGC